MRRTLVVTLGVAALALAGCSIQFKKVPPNAPRTITFVCDNDNADETWTVPPGVIRVNVTVLGAQGSASESGVPGGRGGQVSADLDVLPGQTLNITDGCMSGWPNGGAAGIQCVNGNGGFGGGMTRVLVDGIAIVAGGGGGGGSGGAAGAGGAGGAGGQPGANGSAGSGAGAGGGGGGAGINGGASGGGDASGGTGLPQPGGGFGGSNAGAAASCGGGGGGGAGGGGGGAEGDPGGAGGGGGGNNFVNPAPGTGGVSNVSHQSDVRTGEGAVFLTYVAP